eukprot:TRINITY_DN6540_c0_g1_i6.p1 TRINITY_DN6540_c0_g1~~TRINITY_DN6540_c0_g1_i6.p1  ORF type:complete len:114 (-),score=30.73 TRINITY_DN6540_c0_g1_i6:72-413(-)
MHPLPKHGNLPVGGKGPTFLPFWGHKPDLVSKLPFFSITIQKCHGFGVSSTSHNEPKYCSFSAAWRSGLLEATELKPGNGFPTPSLFSASVTLCTKEESAQKKMEIIRTQEMQ